jgi:AcrR family transcriptional regulator
MAGRPGRTSRAEQRRRTEARILSSARELFAAAGYERTSIRAVAAAAGVDPGLVMHHFGSKARLFERAAHLSPPPEGPPAGTAAGVAEALLRRLVVRMAAEPVTSLAVLRSMLTHPDAAADVRAALSRQLAQDAAAIAAVAADAPALRASLVGATILGLVVGRYLLELDGLRDAAPEEIGRLMGPCLRALTSSRPAPPAAPRSPPPGRRAARGAAPGAS